MLDTRKQDVITCTPTGVFAARLSTHARLALGLKGPAVPQGLDLSCSDLCGGSKDSSLCDHDQLFLGGWKEGAAQAEQVYAQRDLDRDARILALLLVSRATRPPHNSPWVWAW